LWGWLSILLKGWCYLKRNFGPYSLKYFSKELYYISFFSLLSCKLYLNIQKSQREQQDNIEKIATYEARE
jgi:hypothetical protein